MTNLWNTFDDLLQKDEFRIGTVQSIDENKQLTTLIDLHGTQFTASGTTVAVTKKAFVLNGNILMEAPAIPDGGSEFI